ncbi:MAG: hypothetical protein HY913_22440 [Desulfomonile tiedjei]|nr:hypothetical protein [Desulfomonile tiedjei]
MKASGIALVCCLALLCAWACPDKASAVERKSVDDLLLEAFEAEKAGGDSVKVMEKFQAVLSSDPDNYFALLKMGLMKEAEEGTGSGSAAANYLLRAALAKPNSPEAFLYLAQLYYKIGYIPEGDAYLRMAQGFGRGLNYEGVCLLGWRYEDTGNYFAAVMTYAPAALSLDSQFRGDPFLIKRLYTAALMSGKPYDWVYEVSRLLFRQTGGEIIDLVNDYVLQGFLRSPRLRAAYSQKEAAELIMRQLILNELKSYADLANRVPERYEMPTALYKLVYCDPSEIRGKPFKDPYEAFVHALPDTAGEHERVLGELLTIREEALKEIAAAKNDEEKARRLLSWLKKNVLKDYSAIEGASAKSVVDQKKFDAVTGTILYVLLAQDGKLNSRALLLPGHAYSVVMVGDRTIVIDPAVETNEGFDIKLETLAGFRDRDAALNQTRHETLDEVSAPMELVAQEFADVAVKSVDLLALNKYESLFRRILKEQFGFDDTTQTELIRGLRRYGFARVPAGDEFFSLSLNSPEFGNLTRQMAAADDRFRQETIRQYERNIHILRTARKLAPFDMKFRDLLDDSIIKLARYEYEVANTAMVERAAERVRKFLEINEAELPALLQALGGAKGSAAAGLLKRTARAQAADGTEEERRENWAQERDYWLKGLKRLADAVRQYPCDDRLRRSLAEVYSKGLTLAEQRQDLAFGDELKKYTAGLTP